MHRRSKDTDAKPVVDEELAVESDNSGDAEDSAFKGKGSDHFWDAKKDENTASSDDKHLITDGNKVKENDNEANENKKEEHESSDKGDSGDKLADSKIMARLARAPRRVKDPTFKIPAGVKTGHDNKGDYYIEHTDVEREFNMNLHYNDVRVKLDDKGLFDIGGYDIVKKICTLTLKYSGINTFLLLMKRLILQMKTKMEISL